MCSSVKIRRPQRPPVTAAVGWFPAEPGAAPDFRAETLLSSSSPCRPSASASSLRSGDTGAYRYRRSSIPVFASYADRRCATGSRLPRYRERQAASSSCTSRRRRWCRSLNTAPSAGREPQAQSMAPISCQNAEQLSVFLEDPPDTQSHGRKWRKHYCAYQTNAPEEV